jgi:hypothetical protein
MAKKTINYSFDLPSYDETADIELLNNNTVNIDAELKKNENNTGEVADDLATHLAESVSDNVHGLGSIANKQYTIGVWTPKVYDAGSGSAEEFTYTSRTGKFVRVGDYVYLSCEVVCATKGNMYSDSAIYLGGLPFSSVDSLNLASVLVDNVTATTNIGFVFLPANYGLFKKMDSGTLVNLVTSDVKDNFKLVLSGWYKIV